MRPCRKRKMSSGTARYADPMSRYMLRIIKGWKWRYRKWTGSYQEIYPSSFPLPYHFHLVSLLHFSNQLPFPAGEINHKIFQLHWFINYIAQSFEEDYNAYKAPSQSTKRHIFMSKGITLWKPWDINYVSGLSYSYPFWNICIFLGWLSRCLICI